MRVLVTGGGTGGHIYPALAIARGLQEENPAVEILYVGTDRGMEAELVPRQGLPFKTVTVEGLTRKISLRALATLAKTCRGCFQSYQIIKAFKPDVAVGTGGYVCGPVMLMAAFLKIPTLIHEQNAFPGITNRLLAGRVKKVAVTFPESKKYFSTKADVVVTGLPVRREILTADRREGRANLGLAGDKFTLLVVGGSRGARSINEAMVEVIAQACRTGSMQIIHMTGPAGYDELTAELRARGIELEKHGNIKVTPYLHNMHEAMAAADLIICRAGAATIAELTVRGLPAVLIPYPHAAGNHQEHNARALVRNGAALMILDKNLTPARLWLEVKGLSENRVRLAEMAGKSAAMGKPEALGHLLQIIGRLAGKRAYPRGGQALWAKAQTNETLHKMGLGKRKGLNFLQSEYRNLHLIGIGGSGMSGLATILLQQGYQVSGSDLKAGETVTRLTDLGARVSVGHDGRNIGQDTDLVVISSAIREDNPELAAARARGLTIIKRGQLLAEMMKGTEGIAVAGAHGKTTTSSMIAVILEKNSLDPTVVVGGDITELGGNAKLGSGRFLVAEADESDGSFLLLSPVVEVITNIEDDHLDHYGSREAIKRAFAEFIDRLPKDGVLVAGVDDPNVREVTAGCSRRVVSYGLENPADYTARDITTAGLSTAADIYFQDTRLGRLELNVPGLHNISNAMAAIAVGRLAGLDFEAAARTLADFRGPRRRFQILGEAKGITVVDDYAHHPTEVKATLRAARQTKARRVIGVFQPHRYSRTGFLYKEFGAAFSDADVIIINEIYAAGEQPIAGVSADLIIDAVKQHEEKPVRFFRTLEETTDFLTETAEPGDLIITLGAGNIWTVGTDLIRRLRER